MSPCPRWHDVVRRANAAAGEVFRFCWSGGCAVLLAWLCTSFGQVQATLLGITPAGGRSRSPGEEERAPRTPARPSSTFLAGGSREAPRPLTAVLHLTVPVQRCALVLAQEKGRGHGHGKVRDRQRHDGCCWCGLQPLAQPSSRAAPLGFRHLKQALGAHSCVPLSCQHAAAPCKFFHPVKTGSEVSCYTERLLPSVTCIANDVGFRNFGPYV